MSEIITRYLIRVKKYATLGEDTWLIGEELIETDSGTICSFPENKCFSEEIRLNFTLEFVEERKYKKSGSNAGMIERI